MATLTKAFKVLHKTGQSLFLVLIYLSLNGCLTIMPKSHVAPIPIGMATEATYYDVHIESYDGTRIAATLNQPLCISFTEVVLIGNRLPPTGIDTISEPSSSDEVTQSLGI